MSTTAQNWKILTSRDGNKAFQSADGKINKVVWRHETRVKMCRDHVESSMDDDALWQKLADFVAKQPDDMHRAWAQACVAGMAELLLTVSADYCKELEAAAKSTVKSTAPVPAPDDSAADKLLGVKPAPKPNIFGTPPVKKVNLFGGK